MKNARPVKAVLFDKDGTLLDFKKSYLPMAVALVDRIAERVSHERDCVSAALGLVGTEFTAESVMVSGTNDDIVEALVARFRGLDEAESRAALHAASLHAKTEPLMPLRPLLTHLRHLGVASAVVTNDDTDFSRQQIKALGIDDLVDVVVGADAGFGSKPEPGPCLAAAKALELTAADCVFVGDSFADMHAARAAHMTPIGVLSGFLSANDFVGQAEIVLPDIASLPAWLLAGAARQIVEIA